MKTQFTEARSQRSKTLRRIRMGEKKADRQLS